MSDSKHTPGPWYSDDFGNVTSKPPRQGFKALLPLPNFNIICICHQGPYAANAALIASAPALKAENERLTKKILTLKERSKLHERVFSETIAIIGPLESQHAALLAACEKALSRLTHSEEQTTYADELRAVIEKGRAK